MPLCPAVIAPVDLTHWGAEPVMADTLEIELDDEDILLAMQSVPDYLDITTSDFRIVYHAAYRHGLRHAARTEAMPLARVLEPPRLALSEIARSWAGAFVGMAAVAGVNRLLFPHIAAAMMIGSIGATAALVFGAMRSPLAQPSAVAAGGLKSVPTTMLRMGWSVMGACKA